MITSYIALDIETTGLSPKLDKITEIGALKVIDGQVAGTFSTLVNPGRSLSSTVTELTGLTDGMLAGAPLAAEVIRPLADFVQGLPLIGHNILFDYSFLKQEAVNQKMEFSLEGIDTLRLCRRFMPEESRKNLAAACAYFHIPQEESHRALADAQSACRLYQELARLYGQENPRLFLPEPLIYKAKRDQPATKRQKDYLRDLIKCHRIDVTVQVDAMSRSEASRMIDRIISQYGRMSKIKEVN